MRDPSETIRQVSREVGNCFICCRRLDRPGVFSVRDSEVIPIASMYKVLLAIEVADAFVAGLLLPDSTIRVSAEQHSPGGLGLNQLAHPVVISLADLLYLSLAWSDNTASDLLLPLVGLDALHARAAALGLPTVQVIGTCRALLRNAGEDFGYASEAAATAADWAPPEDTADPVLDRTTRASMADMVKLGSLLARDQAAHPEACSMVRTLMGRQVWTHRFAAAFPSDRWTRNTKTGTLSPWRGEFGIVTRDDGVKLVLAVMLRQHHTGTPDAVADDAVADAARSAAALVMGGEVSGLYAADQAT